jgi:hypothetical protein
VVAHLADQDDVRVLAQRRRSASANERVLRPTSRWFIRQPWLRWTYSIGSSSVITCRFRVRLM